MRPLNEEEGDPDEQRLAQITARIEKIRARMAERRQIEEVQPRQTEGLQKGEMESKRLALLTAMAIQKERLQKKRTDREERLFAICGIVSCVCPFSPGHGGCHSERRKV